MTNRNEEFPPVQLIYELMTAPYGSHEAAEVFAESEHYDPETFTPEMLGVLTTRILTETVRWHRRGSADIRAGITMQVAEDATKQADPELFASALYHHSQARPFGWLIRRGMKKTYQAVTDEKPPKTMNPYNV